MNDVCLRWKFSSVLEDVVEEHYGQERRNMKHQALYGGHNPPIRDPVETAKL
jgi:hypothetical protein